jgi:hypothetical protein
MKKAGPFVVFFLFWTTAFSQHLSFKFGTSFQRTDLDVRWNLNTNALPTHVWTYRLLPRAFSPAAVSNLMAFGSFTAKDIIVSNADEMVFKRGNVAALSISARFGSIGFQSYKRRELTNLLHDVPKLSDLGRLTTNFLNQVGIDISEIEKRQDGIPDFHFSEPNKFYLVNQTLVTNIEFRSVTFRRAVEGARFVGNGAGGDCEIQFGEHGVPSKIWLSWRNLERGYKDPVASHETMTKWMRQGKAVQGATLSSIPPIDWKRVKSVTVKQAKLCYYGGDQFAPSDWLIPFAALWTTVDTGYSNVEVEIDCPCIDEKK